MKTHHVQLVQSTAIAVQKFGIDIINSNGKNVIERLCTTDDNLFRAVHNNKAMACNTSRYNVTPSSPNLIPENIGGTVFCTSAVIVRCIERFVSSLPLPKK